MIQVLDQETINQIAAGEVIERPMAIVKELVENSMDAGATAITIEIKEGGISFVRVTDNGSGIWREDVRMAFLPHATSKIRSAEDLLSVHSLGFRGEALSSIAAVSQVELVTRQSEEITGTRYRIEGGMEKDLTEIGCPEGTTFIMRNLFFNTPARRKFLKTATTEGNYIQDLIQRYSLGHPEIRFHFIVDGKNKLQTSGDENVKTNIFYNYGADVTDCLVPVAAEASGMTLRGFIGRPELSRGNRTFMNYFVNGRYIKSPVITRAIEHAYKGYLMGHRYPFAALLFTMDSTKIDVNVHPTKMEARFSDQEEVYQFFYDTLKHTLKTISLIPKVSVEPERKASPKQPVARTEPRTKIEPGYRTSVPPMRPAREKLPEPFEKNRSETVWQKTEKTGPAEENVRDSSFSDSRDFVQERILFQDEKPRFRMIGQVFDTYWLVEYKSELLIIDQHAAHEKVLYEKLMARVRAKDGLTQNLAAPIVVTLSGREMNVLKQHEAIFEKIGFQFEPFGDKEYVITGIPADFLNLVSRDLFLELLDGLMEEGGRGTPELVLDRCASMACKAAVKGNKRLSFAEASQLLDQMLQTDEPYHCPHGRPTTISMSRQEFEKKFKRIV